MNKFHHGSSNCGSKPSRLKSGGPHFIKNCHIIGLIESPTCINCGKRGHLASWKGCAMFPKATRKLPSSTETSPKRFSSNRIDERISFADTLKNQHRKISPTQPENPQRIFPTNKDLNSLTKNIYIVKKNFQPCFNRWAELIPSTQTPKQQQPRSKNEGVFNPSKPSNGINYSLSLKPKALSSSSLFLTSQ
ncbi:hypothetical protein CEXT_54211 [Caerostris extrusa]|uniref:Uncharacterized protein n=1 Tax=Caerostris extrusa TaxID=172846 RepID=A0AAV4SI87_CAEEX|nr:hypothetical protein CEXT_54211 [Caerostris extrusa]